MRSGEFSYFFYDARGQQTHVLNPRNNSTYFKFDLLGRNTHRTDALGSVAYMAYDEVGNGTLQLDQLGQGTYLTYDRLNRLSHSKDQAAAVTYMGYDARSSAVLRVDAEGRATYLGYDNARRLERQFFANPLTTADSPSYFTYDQVGNLTLVDDSVGGLGASTNEYDKVDRLKKRTTLKSTEEFLSDRHDKRLQIQE